MVKQINLLPWREYEKKLAMKRFIIAWFCIFCFFLILVFTAKIIIIQQIKHYQFAYDHIFLQSKYLSTKIQEIKKLHYEENTLKNIVKAIEINHQQIKKILDLIHHLNYLITPDLFVRFIEFHPPYCNLIMHANSEKEYVSFKKLLQSKVDSKVQWLILNQFQNMQLDFIGQIILNKDKLQLIKE